MCKAGIAFQTGRVTVRIKDQSSCHQVSVSRYESFASGKQGLKETSRGLLVQAPVLTEEIQNS